MSTLAARMARLLALHGPVPVALWMGQANAHYYATRDPLGAAGDFVTAPEISQIFGEMVGVWLADVWARAGSPAPVAYVELGPGRGTLAADALRVMARFGLVPQVHFVETSPVLRAAQARAVPGAQWHDDLSTLPDALPLLLVGNEFLDALPVRQWVKTPGGWRERMVGLDSAAGDGPRFVPVAGQVSMDAAVPAAFAGADVGAIIEASPAAATVMGEVGARLAGQGGAGLIIDYGYGTSQLGSTLQALQGHAHADPFANPGEADLTCLVDFAAAAQAAGKAGASLAPLAEQGAWLLAMGAAQRAAALAKASPAKADAVAQALDRLCSSQHMGSLFKVLALSGGGWPQGAMP